MADPLGPVIRALGRAGSASSDYDLNPDTVLPPGRKLRPAGVLVPLLVRNGEARLILTKRSSALKHHPGQIAFPGGKQDDGDADITAAALREAREEIGLDPGNVESLGQLPGHETVTSFAVTPVVGRVLAPFDPVPEAGEVDEVFDVPLAHVLDAARYSVQGRRWRGSIRKYYTVPFGPYYIWGATARILRTLADAVDRS
ncbi:CoA pyrophosphatase [Roseovarius faecimaris]|uniref:CoA pyrophosphatase n=1 Tax=Roseovarius faecimaris TaxID=2494550 RepID=A0A6I6IV63_9RHOB|nr:CoA pyrophosphatase [Roseovarius faecimaris]QGY00123.1 CoA pyrophosphatase [Roseovarius faecimaris]